MGGVGKPLFGRLFRLVLATALVLVTCPSLSPPQTAAAAPAAAAVAAGRAVVLVIDTSGSMAGTPLDQAKAALTASIDALDPDDRAGLRRYAGNCGDGGTLLVPPATGNRDALRDAVVGLAAAGGTPTPDALRAAAGDYPADATSTLLVLVSDGQSTCGDPCPVAEQIAREQGVGFKAYTVGFNAGGQAESELSCIARVTGGAYFSATDTASLRQAINAAIGASGLPAAALYGGGNPASKAPAACAGDPVDCATGNFWLAATDVAEANRGPDLVLARTYNGQDADQAGPFGHGWSSTYSMTLSEQADGTVSVRQENGSRISFTPSGGEYAAPGWVLATLRRRTDGGWTLTRRAQQVLTFDSRGRLTAVVDPNGDGSVLRYNAAGHLTRVSGSSGRALRVNVDDQGRVTRVRGSLGRTTRYTYDAQGNLVAVRDPAGGTVRYAYDADHRMTSVTDPSGATTRNTYDAGDRVVAQTDAAGGTTTWEYAGSGASATARITGPDGRVVEQVFANGLLAARTVAAGTPVAATTRYTYTAGTLGLASTTDALGRLTSFEYDAGGNVTRLVQPGGGVVTNTYDDLNNLTSTTDPGGATAVMTYDDRGNLLTSTEPTAAGPATTTFIRRGAHRGEVAAVIDAERRRTTYTYTPAGDLASVTDPLGHTTTMSYNAAGELTAERDARAAVTRLRRDVLGRVVGQTSPSGATSRSRYDAAGRLTAVVDAAGATTRFRVDALGRRVRTTRADGSTWLSRYDAAGRLVAETDPNGRVTAHEYDARGLPVRTTLPDGRTSRLDYDAAGQLVTVTDAAGRPTRFGYSVRGDLLTVDYDDATPDVAYEYDANGRRVAMRDGSGESRYTYDAAGRLLTYINGAGRRVGYDYDRSGLLTAVAYPGATRRAVTYRYDAAGRLARLTDWRGGSFRFAYSATWRLVRQVAPNGVETRYSYNADDEHVATRVTGRGGPLLDLAYARDRRGLIAAETARRPGQRAAETRYGHDAIGQMTTAGWRSDRSAYRYDASGQMTSVTRDTGRTSLAYTPNGDLDKLIRTQGRRSQQVADYGYDILGQRATVTTTAGAEAAFSWNQAGDLVWHRGPEAGAGLPNIEGLPDRAGQPAMVDITYAYDGDGLRASKMVGATTTRFTYDVASTTPRLLVAGSRFYVHGPGGQVLEQVDVKAGRTTTRYLHADQLGSTRLLTDERGRVREYVDYTPYGQPRDDRPGTDMLFAGGLRDSETGLSYLINRYYDPRTAQFLSIDPMLAVTGQAYGYVGNSPLNRVDPLGLCWGPGCWVQDHWRDIATAGVVVGGAVAAGVCIAATAGICGGVIGATLVTAGIGAATGAATYALEDTCHTAGGYVTNALLGGAFGGGTGGLARWGLRRGASQFADDLPGLPKSAHKPLNLGSSRGRTTPENLTEQLAMTEVRANPGGIVVSTPMTDARWPATRGWVKMAQNVNGVEIHYVRNTITGAVDDFKFPLP